MLSKIRISDITQTGQRFPCTPHPAFFPKINWPKRVVPVVTPALAPTLDKVRKVPLSGQSFILLFGQDLRPQAE